MNPPILPTTPLKMLLTRLKLTSLLQNSGSHFISLALFEHAYLRFTDNVYFNCCSCWDAFVASSSPCLSVLALLSAVLAMFFYSLILTIKILSKLGLERDLLNLIRVIYTNPADSIMHSGERLNAPSCETTMVVHL